MCHACNTPGSAGHCGTIHDTQYYRANGYTLHHSVLVDPGISQRFIDELPDLIELSRQAAFNKAQDRGGRVLRMERVGSRSLIGLVRACSAPEHPEWWSRRDKVRERHWCGDCKSPIAGDTKPHYGTNDNADSSVATRFTTAYSSHPAGRRSALPTCLNSLLSRSEIALEHDVTDSVVLRMEPGPCGKTGLVRASGAPNNLVLDILALGEIEWVEPLWRGRFPGQILG